MATRYELEELARDHDFLGAAHDRNARRTLWVVALTSVMKVGEVAAGLITGSMALLADGFHMSEGRGGDRGFSAGGECRRRYGSREKGRGK